MELEFLPEELLITIFRKLDTKSLYNLYRTGNSRIRSAITAPGGIKECNFSLNTLATTDTFRINFFKEIAENLHVLNLSGVPDLDKLSLLDAAKNLKNLHTLDVTYTDISLIDLIDVYNSCTTIKNIATNFQFYKTPANDYSETFSHELLDKCQKVFGNFENVHFVGPGDILFFSELPQYILQNAKLNTLTYSVAKKDDPYTCYKFLDGKPLSCNTFYIYFVPWRKFNSCSELAWRQPEKMISKMPFEIEFVFVTTDFIYCSHMFEPYITPPFKVKVCPKYKKKMLLSLIEDESCAAIMIWNKKTTNFDDSFFCNLLNKLKNLHVMHKKYYDGLSLDNKTVIGDWVKLTHQLSDGKKDKKVCPPAEKIRIEAHEPEKVILNYDTLFENMKTVKLSINLDYRYDAPMKVFLSPENNYLKKITFLSIDGQFHFNDDFFDILFRCCVNLVTIDLNLAVCTSTILKSIKQSHSLKNLRLVEKTFNFDLLELIGECKTLEIIHLVLNSQLKQDLGKTETLFTQLDNLYYFSIEAYMTPRDKAKYFRQLHKLKLRFKKSHLRIELRSNAEDYNYIYDPYLEVFNLDSIKVLS